MYDKSNILRAVRPVNAPLLMTVIRLTNCRLLYLNNKLLLKYKSRQSESTESGVRPVNVPEFTVSDGDDQVVL